MHRIKSSKAMLEMMKVVLKNVSNDAHYFKKELLKAYNWLSNDDMSELKFWLRANFGSLRRVEIEEVLQLVAISNSER